MQFKVKFLTALALMLYCLAGMAAEQTIETTLSINSKPKTSPESAQVPVLVKLVNAGSPKAILVFTTKKPKNIIKFSAKDVQPIRSILTSIKMDDTNLENLMKVVLFGEEAGMIKGYISSEKEANKYVVFYPGNSVFFFKLKEIDELVRLLDVLEASAK
jgi:hypothetical protein